MRSQCRRLVCSNRNFTLSIIDKSLPQPLVIPEDQVVNKNEDAMFHCQFTATPDPVLEWFFEDHTLLSNKSRVTVFQNGSLLISAVRPRSSGMYQCVGTGHSGKKTVLKASLHLAGTVNTPHLPPSNPRGDVAPFEMRFPGGRAPPQDPCLWLIVLP
ncbi:hypothetical protein GDO86_019676 [Hymenochirus boettgeri]|uniref:Ig-like domain-containing protein n=1 Tax=Hymenochirus boettgeri TaxID=247094 RepID=A0A8T2IHH4_9PIPI|nr:hypothetical protein GDO86_019676 [Hymenochirus boettgeri]